MTHSQHLHGQHPHEHGEVPSHGHSSANGHSHEHPDDQGMAEMLDMDAALQAAHLAEITGWVAGLAGAPETIVDLGSGTGTGTLALAGRFEKATVFAVDNSEQMLAHLAAKAAARGLDGRVVKVHADMDAQWPEIGAADLVWAASSIHHVADPDKVFAEVFAALNPGGLFAVVEMDSFPRFLPDDIGWGEPGLEDRSHRLIDAQGWNAHPDWQEQLEAAGFEVEQRNFSYELAPEPEAMATYAQMWLGRTRTGLEDKLSPADLASMDALLDPENPAGLGHRTDLVLRGSRTVWAARRP
ncbi:methyltransferase domain-containing protein [Paeniglutamicibacter sp. NPDC091659]|uniref:methyltransferase domain-containing protein n=1 Tax=Paeniglutamicibacter sp. NPDC091659 TaxID=3364389 RepID=UPI003820E13A